MLAVGVCCVAHEFLNNVHETKARVCLSCFEKFLDFRKQALEFIPDGGAYTYGLLHITSG